MTLRPRPPRTASVATVMNTTFRADRRYQLTSHVLTNGLRVLVAPGHDAEVVAVTVGYDVGSRSEPRGFSGFAHLF